MRNRLLAAFLAIAFAIIVIQDLPLATYLQRVERDSVMLSLERDAWTIANSAEPLIAQGDLTQLAQLAHAFAVRSSSRVDIVDGAGTVVATTSGDELGYDYSNRVEIKTALTGMAVVGERDSAALGGRMLYVAVPLRSGATPTGALRITYPVASVDDIVARRIRSIYLSGLVTLLVAVTAAVLLAGVYTRRLRRIHAATEQLATGDLSTRIPASDVGAPELIGLEHSFNVMAARLQTLVESQHSFASDASHQLRTPLTALRLRLENAAEQNDPQIMQQSLDEAIVEVQRLQVLIDGLLAIARLEGTAIHTTAIDVDSVIAQRVELWQPLMDEQSITLDIHVPNGLRVLAAPGALEQILDSYLDNALEYAPRGSHIRLTADTHDHAVTFHVADEGPGMPEAARIRAFDRFWRGHADGAGTGLGLAIAQRLAEVSGGVVRLDAVVPHGVDAVLQLKRA